MYCTKCNQSFPENYKHCANCGSELVSEHILNNKKENKGNLSLSSILIAVSIIFVGLFFVIAIINSANKSKRDEKEQLIESYDSIIASLQAENEALQAENDSLFSENNALQSEINTIKNRQAIKQGESVIDSSDVVAAPLTDFYIDVYDDGTIWLKAYETHNKECYIPSVYTIDGEEYRVTRIDDACFFGRTSLDILSIPEGVTSIGYNAFNSCSVYALYFPSTLKDISGIFDYLHGNETIYFAGTAEQWGEIDGSEDLPSSITLVFDTPVIEVVDETNYNIGDLTLVKSGAEELGGSLANAFNGFMYGFFEGLSDDD